MGRGSCISLLFVHLYLNILLLVKCQTPLLPALFVFGDSIVDSGNSNYLKTKAKANCKPYGIDFLSGATGRFTNGKTIADFIAQSLGLPFPPPYLGLCNVEKSRIVTGVNYASGSAGILPETGRHLGMNLNFDDQIKYFQHTVTKDLPNFFKTPLKHSQYLSKPIFLISIGNNDYLNNYLKPAHYNSSKLYTPLQFGQLLLEALRQRLTRLYRLGARKFVVIEITALGCLPAVVNSIDPKLTIPCVDYINKMVSIFNVGLPSMILELHRTLSASIFVREEIYRIFYDMNQNPSKYGEINRTYTRKSPMLRDWTLRVMHPKSNSMQGEK